MMHSLEALSVTAAVNDWLTNTQRPRLLHIFDCAANLINERGEILSIVTLEIGNGPFNLVVETDLSFVEHLNIESAVSVSAKHLALGNLNISTEKAGLWNPCLDWEKLHTYRSDITKHLMKLPITNYQPLHTSLQSPVSDQGTSRENHAGLLDHQQFSNFLLSNDLASAKLYARRLAGLGMGLTPAGDDYLMGALYAIWIIHPPQVAGVLTQAIAEIAAPLTTSLSAAWIRSAGSGEAGVLWHRLFEALMAGDAAEIHTRVEDILSVGETSGADAFSGFVEVFTCFSNQG